MANPDLIAGYPVKKYSKQKWPNWIVVPLIIAGIVLYIALGLWAGSTGECQPYRDSSGEYIEC